MRAASLKSLLLNYVVLQQLWQIAQGSTSGPTIKSRIIGVESQFRKFSFFFGNHTDYLSKTLQSPAMSVSEGAHIAVMTVMTLQALCSDDQCSAFWGLDLKAKQELDVQDPELPRKRNMPRRFDDGAPGDFLTYCITHYHQSYFEALELAFNAIQERFDQPDFQSYCQLEELLHTIRGEDTEETLTFVCNVNG